MGKKHRVDIWVSKMHFPKNAHYWAPIELEGPGIVSSQFVKSPASDRALRGIDNSNCDIT